MANLITPYQYTLADAFPEAPLPLKPFGSRVLVQLRSPPSKTKGGIMLTDYSKDREKDIVQVGKILALGPLSFHNRQTQQLWPEGAWCGIGDIIYVPRYGGDRWSIKVGDTDVLYALFNDLDLGGLILGDPLTVRTFIDINK